MELNNKHIKTLKAIFTNPIKPDILWHDIERLFIALDGNVTEGKGSRVRVFLNGEKAVFHEPHPEKVADKGTVKSVREFLVNAGIQYNEEQDE